MRSGRGRVDASFGGFDVFGRGGVIGIDFEEVRVDGGERETLVTVGTRGVDVELGLFLLFFPFVSYFDERRVDPTRWGWDQSEGSTRGEVVLVGDFGIDRQRTSGYFAAVVSRKFDRLHRGGDPEGAGSRRRL